jgi:hypothetical protein
MEEKTCRFCLGTSEKYDNIFISPCNCIGSIQYIHTYCLTRWRISQIPFIDHCSLCHTNYNVNICIIFESTYLNQIKIRNILRNGVLIFFLVNYIYIFVLFGFNQKHQKQNYDLLEYKLEYDRNQFVLTDRSIDILYNKKYDIVYNLLMIIIMSAYNGMFCGIILKVQNKLMYFKHWIKRDRIHLTICFFLLLISNLSGPMSYFLNGFIHTLFYPVLLQEHNNILENMNRELIENVGNIE